MRVFPVASVGLAAAAVIGCGGAAGNPPPRDRSGSSPAPAVLVSPPPANAVIDLTADELRDLAHEHRIKTATIYDNGVVGMMVSDVSSGQQFSAPRPGSPGAVAALARGLTEGGAAVATKHGSRP